MGTFFWLTRYIPLKINRTNYLLQYLLITLRNTTRTIIPWGPIDYDNPVAINIERNKNYRVSQERCTARPQSRTQEPPTDLHNSWRIYDALKRLLQNYAQASVEEFGIRNTFLDKYVQHFLYAFTKLRSEKGGTLKYRFGGRLRTFYNPGT